MTADGLIHIQRHNILPHRLCVKLKSLLVSRFFSLETVETSGCLCAGRNLSALPY